jgi:hypothetical protein
MAGEALHEQKRGYDIAAICCCQKWPPEYVSLGMGDDAPRLRKDIGEGTMDTIDANIAEFRQCAIDITQARLELKYRLSDRLVVQMRTVFKRIVSLGLEARDSLAELTTDGDESVRLYASMCNYSGPLVADALVRFL